MNGFLQSHFSPKRFWFLIRKDFLQIFRPMAILFGALGISVLIFGFLSSAMGGTGRMHYSFFYFFLYVLGAVLASLVFQPMHKKEKNMEFLSIPASTLEKFLVKWLFVTVGLVASMLIFSSLMSLITEGLSQLAFEHHHELFNPVHKDIWKAVLHFVILQSVFFLGGAYFRRIQFITTSLMLGVIGFICMILVFIFVGVVILQPLMQNVMAYSGLNQMQGDMSFIEQALGPYFDIISWILKIFYFGILAPLSYVIAFFRLKEAQVNYGV